MTPQEQRPGNPPETNIQRIMRLAKEKKAQGISIKQPASSPAPAVTETQPTEGEPEVKIEVIPRIGEEDRFSDHLSVRNVNLRINGEEAPGVWQQERISEGKFSKGRFYLDKNAPVEKDLPLPLGTHFHVSDHRRGGGISVYIAGGKNTRISQDRLEKLRNTDFLDITTKDDMSWEAPWEKPGRATIEVGGVYGKTTKNLSPEEAIDRLLTVTPITAETPSGAPAEAEPDVKVEVLPIGEGTGSDREVILKINGENTGIVWREAQGQDSFGKELKGLFYLSEITATEGYLRLPKGTRLSIDSHVYTLKNYLRITGGKDTKISLAELKYLKGLSLSISLSTPDDGNWQIVSPYFGKEGTANVKYLEGDIFSGEGATKSTGDLSVTEALDFFKKSLGFKQQPAAAAAEVPFPTNPATADALQAVVSTAEQGGPAVKIEVQPRSDGENKYSRKVDLKINGQNISGIVWEQPKFADKVQDGRFAVDQITTTAGSLSLPEGTHFEITCRGKNGHMRVCITGGEGVRISLADLKRFKEADGQMDFSTRAWEYWTRDRDIGSFEKGSGKAIVRNLNTANAETNLSVPEALDRFKKALGQALEVTTPGETPEHPFSRATFVDASEQSQMVPQTPEEKIRTDQAAVTRAVDAWYSAHVAYSNALDRYEPFKTADVNWLNAWNEYYGKVRESGLKETDFQATPEGQTLMDKTLIPLGDARDRAKQAFQATPEGQTLYNEAERLRILKDKAEEALTQDGLKTPFPSPTVHLKRRS